MCLTLYNEGKGVQRVLDYLALQRAFIKDVVIISDACRDQTDSLVSKWCQKPHGFSKLFISRPERHGRASAIRLCLSHTKCDINVIMAGDIQPIKESLCNLISYFKSSSVGAVTGHPILLNKTASIADCLSHIIWESHDNSGESLTRKGDFFHLNGEMLAIKKSALHGFESYNGIAEDAMMGYLIKEAGYRVVWARDVEYYMQYPSSLSEYIKIRKRSCFGRTELAKQMNLSNYPYYELSHSEYFINILKIALSSPKMILSLLLGVPIELLCRIYYQLNQVQDADLLKRLWQPSGETKW